MKKGMSTLLNLIISLIVILAMTKAFSQSFSSIIDDSYSDDAKRFKDFLSSDVDSSTTITFAEGSSKELVLGNTLQCNTLSDASERGFLPSNAEDNRFYFCFYDKNDKSILNCGYVENKKIEVKSESEDRFKSDIELQKILDIKTFDNDKKCFYIPKEYNSLYRFNLNYDSNDEVYYISISKQ